MSASAVAGDESGSPDEIVLSAVLPLSGDLSELGNSSGSAITLAVEDMNSLYQ